MLIFVGEQLEFEEESVELVSGLIDELSNFYAWALESNLGSDVIINSKKVEEKLNEEEKKKWDNVFGLNILPLVKQK